MILGIKNHKFQYEAEKLTRVFYPNEKITVVIGDSFKDGEALLLTEFTDSEVRVVFTDEAGSVLYSEENSLSGVSDGELLMAQMMFRALVKITGYTPKWGILTGIRPSKLLRNLKATYGDKLSTVVLPEGWSWKEGETVIDAAGEKTYKAIFTPSDTDNYETVEKNVTISVAKAIPTGLPNYDKIKSSGKTLRDTFIRIDGSTFNVPGIVEWVDDNNNPLSDDEKIKSNTNYTWRFTPDDTDNYEVIYGEILLYKRSSSSGGIVTYTVTFNSNGGSDVAAKNVKNGKTLAKPADPTKAGNKFIGWYKDKDCKGLPFSFETDAITANTDLYALWVAVGERQRIQDKFRPRLRGCRARSDDYRRRQTL